MPTYVVFSPAAPSRRREIAVVLLYAVLSIALLSPMASDTPTSAPDLKFHLSNIVQAKLAIDQGQFPLRTAPLSYDGWGYPLYQFYGQLPYTVAGLAYKYITPDNPYVALKLVLWAMLTLAGYFIYRLAFQLTRSRVASILAGAVYAAAPYFLINIHARGDFAEACAQGVLPIVLYTSVRSYSSRKPAWLIAAGLAWFALATTHIITFVRATVIRRPLFLARGDYPQKEDLDCLSNRNPAGGVERHPNRSDRRVRRIEHRSRRCPPDATASQRQNRTPASGGNRLRILADN